MRCRSSICQRVSNRASSAVAMVLRWSIDRQGYGWGKVSIQQLVGVLPLPYFSPLYSTYQFFSPHFFLSYLMTLISVFFSPFLLYIHYSHSHLLYISNQWCYPALLLCVILLRLFLPCSSSLAKAIAVVVCVCVCVCDGVERGSAVRWWYVKSLTLHGGWGGWRSHYAAVL